MGKGKVRGAEKGGGRVERRKEGEEHTGLAGAFQMNLCL
jgi:hypothetical protein